MNKSPALSSMLANKAARPVLWWRTVREVFGSVLTYTYLCAMAVYVTQNFPLWKLGLLAGLVGVLVVVEFISWRAYRNQPPVLPGIVLLLARAVIIEVMATLDHFSYASYLHFALPVVAMLYFGERVGYLAGAVTWLAFWLNLTLFSRDLPRYYENLFAWSGGLILILFLARTILQERASRARTEQLLGELDTSHQQLQQYAEQVKTLATTEERNRIAREIHDSLGHYLTAMSVQLEKAVLLYEVRPAEAYQNLTDSRRMVTQALQEVRLSVATLRQSSEPFQFETALAKLVQEARASASFQLDYGISGSTAGFSSQVLLTLHRVAQEALTNIKKYAGASQVSLQLNLSEDAARLEVRDNGRGFDPAQLHKAGSNGREGGYGLQGLRERLELVGGQLALDSRPDSGTTLIATTPKIPIGATV